MPARLQLADDAFLFSPDPACERPWHPDHFTRGYREVADPLGITEPLKNLRHFNATQLLAAGVDLRTTAGRLGHSDGGATTLKVYAHWMQSTDRVAVEQLSTDMARLRTEQAAIAPTPAVDDAVSTALPRAAYPISDILTPVIPGVSNYRVIAKTLGDAIAGRKLQPGDLVPTVDEIATWFAVARSTAQRAVAALGESGVIERSGHRWIVVLRGVS